MSGGADNLAGFDYDLAIVGAGNMAEAIVRGILGKSVLPAQRIIAADVSLQRRELFQRHLGVRAIEDNAAAARSARNVLLSVKPQQMAAALGALAATLNPRARVISIAAGISTRFIESHLAAAGAIAVIRTMPNTPMLVGEGVVAMAAGTNATADDLTAVRRLFEAAATVLEVSEDKINAVTALSGSGPAYVFYLVEQMIRAGVSLGLSQTEAHLLATRTALGAGKMLAASSESPQELRRKVTSPKGTTEAAVNYLDSHEAGQAIFDAVRAAAARSKELGT